MNDRLIKISPHLLWLFLVIQLMSCRERSIRDGDSVLQFSADTIFFDTVFTQLGSATRRFKVYNPYNEIVIIDRVQMRDGKQSKFRFNANGRLSHEAKNIELEPRDSIFVFVEVTLDPNDQSLPLVVEDAVQFLVGGKIMEVVLNAWGQDAYYYVPTRSVRGFPPFSFMSEKHNINTTEFDLPNDKPHVIFGYVQIDSLLTLNVQPGTEFFFYANSGLWAYRGSTLKVKGDPGNEVYFRGFRKESFYNTLPGQWDRIILNESPNDHEIEWAVIENSFIGISAEYFYLTGNVTLPNNKLVLKNTIIQNAEGVGILSRFYNIEAENCLISNAQSRLMGIQGGGTHTFTHCTFGNYWRFGNRRDPSIFFGNVFRFNATDYILPLSLTMNNSIVFGSLDEELEADTTYIADSPFDVMFHHSVIRSEETSEERPNWFRNCVLNPRTSQGFSNPLFVNTEHKRRDRDAFYLHSASAAVGVGDPTLPNLPQTDLKGDNRSGTPDAGAYQR